MKKLFLSLILAQFLAVGVLFIKSVSAAPVTIFSDSFGSTATNNVSGWTETEDLSDFVKIAIDSPRPESSTVGYAFLGDDGSMSITVDTSDYEDIVLTYFWRGSDNENTQDEDTLKVFWKKNFDSEYILLNSHSTPNEISWNDEEINLPDDASNSLIDIKFFGNTGWKVAGASVDDVEITGSVIPTPPPVITNSCPLPDALGDETAETVNPAPEGEQDLQLVLDNASYTLNVTSDQKQFQKWNIDANSRVEIDAKFINEFAGYSSVFGFYKNDDLDSFTPIFKTAAIAGYESTPLSTSGPFALDLDNATSIGFAIKTWNGATPQGTFATKNSLNSGSRDQVVVYNPTSNTYVLGFEDLVNGDNDFNDLVVEIELDCEEIEEVPENSAPIADAGPDQIITLPTNSVNLNGTGTDSDGTISSYVWTQTSGSSVVNPDDVEDPSASPLIEGTYVFKLTVTDDDGATDDDEVTITINPAQSYICSDGLDNDSDGLIDENDPGCRNKNSDLYDPFDDSEENDTSNTNGGGGGGGGGGGRVQCSDNKDNSDPEDTLEDEDDPGCHTDGNPNNPDSYVRSDRSEVDGGEILGAQNACGIYVDKFLRRNHNNNPETVKKVQQFLNDYMNTGLAVDGIYGSKTETAVMAFQLKHTERVLAPWGISNPTGIFYLTTQTEVNNIMCPELNLDIPSNLIPFKTHPEAPVSIAPVNSFIYSQSNI